MHLSILQLIQHDLRFVRTTICEVKLVFIFHFSCNRNAFYLYTATSVACSNTLCYVHAWLYKGCGYCTDLSVHWSLYIDFTHVVYPSSQHCECAMKQN